MNDFTTVRLGGQPRQGYQLSNNRGERDGHIVSDRVRNEGETRTGADDYLFAFNIYTGGSEMQAFMLTDSGKRPVTILDAFDMGGADLVVVDATCGGRYPEYCAAIICDASLIVFEMSDQEAEDLCEIVLELHDRHSRYMIEECIPFAEFQPAELRALGIEY